MKNFLLFVIRSSVFKLYLLLPIILIACTTKKKEKSTPIDQVLKAAVGGGGDEEIEMQEQSYRITPPGEDGPPFILLEFKNGRYEETTFLELAPNRGVTIYERTDNIFTSKCSLSLDDDAPLREADGKESIRYVIDKITFGEENSVTVQEISYSDNECKTLWKWEDGDEDDMVTELRYDIIQ